MKGTRGGFFLCSGQRWAAGGWHSLSFTRCRTYGLSADTPRSRLRARQGAAARNGGQIRFCRSCRVVSLGRFGIGWVCRVWQGSFTRRGGWAFFRCWRFIRKGPGASAFHGCGDGFNRSGLLGSWVNDDRRRLRGGGFRVLRGRVLRDLRGIFQFRNDGLCRIRWRCCGRFSGLRQGQDEINGGSRFWPVRALRRAEGVWTGLNRHEVRRQRLTEFCRLLRPRNFLCLD